MKAGIHAIIEKINEDAQRRGSERYAQITNAVDWEIEGENAVHRMEADKQRDILKKHNEHEHARRLERQRSRLNRELLVYQRELADEIFGRAVARLRDAPEGEFAEMFKAAVKGLAGRFTLQLGALSRDKLSADAIREAETANAGLKLALAAETVPLKSGFVIKDDNVEYNCLFEDLVEDKKSEQMAAVMREVFGDSGKWMFT
jgi:vacuolar-type H+-ATPase subunit E/Vma4